MTFQHDPENNKACVPGGENGNYIMFARATSGDKNNNKQFSPCSLNSINQVLRAKARGPKGCFKGNKYLLRRRIDQGISSEKDKWNRTSHCSFSCTYNSNFVVIKYS